MADRSQEEAGNVSDETHFKIGQHEADIETLKRTVLAMDGKIDQLMAYQQQAKGGYRMLLAVGTVAGAAGGMLVKMLTVFARGGV